MKDRVFNEPPRDPPQKKVCIPKSNHPKNPVGTLPEISSDSLLRTPQPPKLNHRRVPCGFWCLDDNIIKGLTEMLSVEHELSEELIMFNTKDQSDIRI
jgi:hypothetical protein